MKRDFTFSCYEKILTSAIKSNYKLISVEDYFLNNYETENLFIIRHDVDKRPKNSLNVAKIENSLGIRTTYYFRILPCSNKPKIIQSIASLGHEIGYHYEDLALSNGDYKKAIISFKKNLDYFRGYYPVKTICMHGSPFSKWDNKLLWNYYNYKNYGLIAEPFFDLDFDFIKYLSDTGRKWNNNESNIRDNIKGQRFFRINSSYDLINKIRDGELGQLIHMTTHPQRWDNNLFPWTIELINQSLKNIVKRVVKKMR